MILFPNETDKVYVGAAHGTGYRNVDADGSFSTAGGPTTKDSVTVSYGHSVSPRFFATLTASYLRNELNGQKEDAVGDPFLALRYTLVMASIVDEWVPQLQLLLGYKRAVSRSIHQSRELDTQLDVFGNGFSEKKVGIDIWYGQTPVQFGVAEVMMFPEARTFDGVTYKPGIGSRSTVTVGRMWEDHWKSAGGSNLEIHEPLHATGVSDSNQLNHSLFFTQDWLATSVDDVRLTVSQQAAYGTNKNTAQATIINLAYMRSF